VVLVDVFEAIKGRRSIRAFKTQNVPDETVEKLLDAARFAPSAGNIQPWEFVVIRNAEMKKELSEAAFGQSLVEEASVVIVVCANEVSSAIGYGLRGKSLYCIQDTAAAAQNILLAAYSLGLGTCWIGAFNEQKVAKVVKTPEEVRPIAIILIGYPDETPSPRNMRSLSQIIHYETF
jgi:nitroreductase